MYATGRDCDIDLIAAHKWFNIAAIKGSARAAELRSEPGRERCRSRTSSGRCGGTRVDDAALMQQNSSGCRKWGRRPSGAAEKTAGAPRTRMRQSDLASRTGMTGKAVPSHAETIERAATGRTQCRRGLFVMNGLALGLNVGDTKRL